MRRACRALGIVLLGVSVACAPAGRPPGPQDAAPPRAGAGEVATSAPSPVRLRLPFSQAAASNGAWFVAQEGGIFARNGLEVELINLGAGQVVQAALVSGEVVATASGGPAAVNAIAAGANVIIVGVSLDTLGFQLVALSQYASIPELRGATIGINRLGGLPHMVLRLMLRQGGVDTDHEAGVIQIGQQPERVVALRSGAIQATLLIPPFGALVEQEGLRILADSADLGIAYPNGALVMNRDWLRTERDTARRVLQSLLEGKRAFKSDRELAIRSLQRWLQIDDRALLEDTHTYFSKILEDGILPRPEGLQLVLDELAAERPELRALRPEDLVDASLAAELRW